MYYVTGQKRDLKKDFSLGSSKFYNVKVVLRKGKAADL